MSNWLALLPGYRALAKRLDQLQLDNGFNIAHADSLKQDLERMTKERDDARAQRDRIQQELYKADAEIERLIDANAALKAQADEEPIPGVSSEFLNKLESYVEKGKGNEKPMATNVTQDKKKPLRTARRTTPSSD